jgi:hypothetical protein
VGAAGAGGQASAGTEVEADDTGSGQSFDVSYFGPNRTPDLKKQGLPVLIDAQQQ